MALAAGGRDSVEVRDMAADGWKLHKHAEFSFSSWRHLIANEVMQRRLLRRFRLGGFPLTLSHQRPSCSQLALLSQSSPAFLVLLPAQ
jgi:hypothetical protein